MHARTQFQTELPGGRSAEEKLFEQQVGRAPTADLDVAEAGGLRIVIRPSAEGSPTVEIFDPVARTLEKIRFGESNWS